MRLKPRPLRGRRIDRAMAASGLEFSGGRPLAHGEASTKSGFMSASGIRVPGSDDAAGGVAVVAPRPRTGAARAGEGMAALTASFCSKHDTHQYVPSASRMRFPCDKSTPHTRHTLPPAELPTACEAPGARPPPAPPSTRPGPGTACRTFCKSVSRRPRCREPTRCCRRNCM